MADIITMSSRGTITIPNTFRKKIKTVHLSFQIKGNDIVFTPVQTREEFFAELEEAEKDYEKNGGITLKEMKKKYNLVA